MESSKQLPSIEPNQKQRLFPTLHAVDKRSLATGLGGLLLWLSICIVTGLVFVATVEQIAPNPESFIFILFFFIGVFSMPIASAFALIMFLPLLMMQRYLTRAVFVVAVVWINVRLLCWGIAIINDDPSDFARVWDDIAPLIFGYGLSLGVVASAIQWFSSTTLRPKMKLSLPPKRASIAESLELMIVAALVFVVCRSFFENLMEPINFGVAVGLGAAAGFALSTLSFGMLPTVELQEVSSPKASPRRIGMIILTNTIVIGITTAAWAVWIEPTLLPLELTLDSGVGLAFASLFSAVIFITSTSVGLRWLCVCGWTLQKSRG